MLLKELWSDKYQELNQYC